jgi:hypothetical protein
VTVVYAWFLTNRSFTEYLLNHGITYHPSRNHGCAVLVNQGFGPASSAVVKSA